MDQTIFYIFLAGGFIVILTYWYHLESLKKVAKAFGKEDYKLWLFSALFTTASVIYLFIYFSFVKEIDDWERTLFLVSEIVFLTFASFWSTTIYYKNIYYEQLILFIVALSTLGLLVATIYSEESDWLVVTSALIIFFHHTFYDSMKWIELEKKLMKKS